MNHSPQTPLRRPQNGAPGARPELRTRVRQTGSGRRYPILGPPSNRYRGQLDQVTSAPRK
jgi:hypothetical protein